MSESFFSPSHTLASQARSRLPLKNICVRKTKFYATNNIMRRLQNNDRGKYAQFGVTPGKFQAMLKKQNYVCAACGQKETTKYKGRLRELSIDHCHTTGRVRGLLCGNCNRALGLVHEEIERLKALIRYLEEQEDNIQAVKELEELSFKLEPGLTDNLY